MFSVNEIFFPLCLKQVLLFLLIHGSKACQKSTTVFHVKHIDIFYQLFIPHHFSEQWNPRVHALCLASEPLGDYQRVDKQNTLCVDQFGPTHSPNTVLCPTLNTLNIRSPVRSLGRDCDTLLRTLASQVSMLATVICKIRLFL